METLSKPTVLDLTGLNLTTSDTAKVFSFLSGNPLENSQGSYQEPTDVISYIRNGIPKQAVNAILEKTGISRLQLSNILHISTRQLGRYEEQDKLSVEQSNFLYEFTRLYIRGLNVLGDKATVDQWLSRVNLALGEKTPLELLDTIEGFRLVDDLLAQIEYGFYS
jgi:putative toxin-antitoxin system antitoxin component (TIGR02293 family)